MPIMNGIECTQKIRAYERSNNLISTCIVGLSGLTDDMIRDKCFEIGMNAFSN